jgi:hypothetical protein
MLFAAGYILVNHLPMQRKINHNLHHLHHLQEGEIAEGLLPDLQRLDRFIDIQLQQLGASDSPSSTIPDEGSIRRYANTMTPDTQNALNDMLATLNNNYNNELDTAQIRAIQTKSDIDALFTNMNDTLLRELQKNYTSAHVINARRNATMKSINDLPLKVMS